MTITSVEQLNYLRRPLILLRIMRTMPDTNAKALPAVLTATSGAMGWGMIFLVEMGFR
jgi:hypothetical protein